MIRRREFIAGFGGAAIWPPEERHRLAAIAARNRVTKATVY